MIENAVEWRKKNGINHLFYSLEIDKLLYTPFAPDDMKFFRENFPHNIHKADLQGHPVLYFDFGRVNLVKLKSRFSDHTLIMMHIQMLEYIV